MGTTWTDFERDELVRLDAAKTNIDEITAQLGRSRKSINAMRQRMRDAHTSEKLESADSIERACRAQDRKFQRRCWQVLFGWPWQ